MLALYALLKCIFVPGTKIVIVGSAFRQSKIIFEYMENMWNNSAILRSIFTGNNDGPRRDVDRCTIRLGDSWTIAVPLGTGEKIRGLRAHIIIADEFASISSEIYETVVSGFAAVSASPIQNVKSNLQGSLIEIQNKSSATPPEIGLNSAVIEKYDGSINQKMGYLEIPLEMSYQLVDKKFGLQIISGFSSLILNQNSVAVQSNGQVITIGEATNLNDIHFSGNVGFGVRYRFLKSFNANLNPMFKYQFNTFSNDSGNFKPYLFGLYTGISYTF
jgi:hypothetical protein